MTVISRGLYAGDSDRIGNCDECEKDRALELRARDILKSRSEELRRRIVRQMDAVEPEIAQQVEEQLAAYISQVRPQIESGIRAHLGQWAREQAEAELLGEITAELRTGA